jgi:glutamate transport system permease protein
VLRSRILSIVIAVVVLGIVGYSAFTLSQQGLFSPERWNIFNDPLVWLDLLQAAVFGTLRAAAVAAVGALILGMIIALLRMSKAWYVRVPTTVVIEFLRGMPVLLLMFFILLVFRADTFVAVVVALVLYNGVIIGEALRSGVVALPRGQREAGLAIGMTGLQTRFSIEFPQAFRNMLPIIIAQCVVLLKDTSLGYIVGYQELIRRGRLVSEFFGAGTYAFSVFIVITAMYLTINLTVSAIARLIARRSDRRRNPRGPAHVDTTVTDQSLQGSMSVGGTGSGSPGD